MKVVRWLILVTVGLLLSACATITTVPNTPTVVVPSTVTITYTPTLELSATATNTHITTPTSTSTPTPTLTPVPLVNLESSLFFDYNGNGLKEVAEPPIENFRVCAQVRGQDKVCVNTDRNGHFEFEKIAPADTQVALSFVDPNANNPALAFRYINVWKKSVVIPAYEMSRVKIPEQQLNDTEIVSLDKGLSVSTGKKIQIGLMQGFLTLPFLQSQVPKPFIWNFFDVLNDNLSCDKPEISDGVILNYDGKRDVMGDPFAPTEGVSDSHNGLDYILPIGTVVIHAAPTSNVWYLPKLEEANDELRVHTLFREPDGSILNFKNAYGHLGVRLVQLNQTVYRGQIIALSGDSGKNNMFKGKPAPILHFDLSRTTPEKCTRYLDPYRSTISPPPSSNFSGSAASYWTVDNKPQFSH